MIKSSSFAFSGLGIRDKLLFKSMVERAAQRTERRWQLALIENADCLFCLGNAPSERAPGAHIIALLPDGATLPGRTLRFPPRVNEIVASLNAINVDPPQQSLTGTSDNWLTLSGMVHEWMQKGQGSSVLRHRDGVGWQLDAERRQARAIGDGTPGNLLTSRASDWCFELGSTDAAGVSRPVEPVLWTLGRLAGNVGVLGQLTGRSLRLRVWPYLLSDAPRSYSTMALSLKRQPRTSAELIVQSRASREDVAGFINASLMCGFLVPIVEPPASATHIPATIRPGRFTQLLGAVRKALGISHTT